VLDEQGAAFEMVSAGACDTLLGPLLGLFIPGPEQQRGMPEVPSVNVLKSAVKINAKHVSAHFVFLHILPQASS
jgi:hypothetical protein